MPTYEYVCDRCGHEFELFQKMTDAPRKRCPRCRSAVRRRIGAGAGLLFKGSGFYATDYRSADYQTKAKAEKGGGETSPTATKEKAAGKAAENAPGKPLDSSNSHRTPRAGKPKE